jgi:protein-S-isoprenylcysteine O-methyltransferase Ste14
MPMTRAEKHGEQAWDDCRRYRRIAGFFVAILLMNMILWYWIPVPDLNWVIHPNFRIPQFIGTMVLIPFAIILVKALKDAGRESFEPTQETKLYGGIYNYIRHPQLLGRTPLTLVLTLWLNSLFLFIFACIFLGFFVPAIIHYEEKDLVKRFGDSYIQYRERTGAIFPKLRRRED